MKRIILALLVIALIGGAGYAGWQYRTSNSNNSVQNSSLKKNYLNIPEKGVKLMLTPNIQDAYYYYKNNTVYLSLSRFKGIKGAEGCTAEGEFNQGGGIAALSVYKVGDDRFGTTLTKSDLEQIKRDLPEEVIQIEDTYFWIEFSKAPCVSNESKNNLASIEDEAVNLRKEFLAAFKTIQKI